MGGNDAIFEGFIPAASKILIAAVGCGMMKDDVTHCVSLARLKK